MPVLCLGKTTVFQRRNVMNLLLFASGLLDLIHGPDHCSLELCCLQCIHT